MKKCLIIYRGPLQRSRLSLIITSYLEVFENVDFVWLVPHPKYLQNGLAAKFFDQFNLKAVFQIDGRLNQFFSSRKFLQSKFDDEEIDRLSLVGTTSLFFLPRKTRLLIDLFVNGIPEERFFHEKGLKNRIQVNLMWKLVSFYKVDRLISVSKYMSIYLKKRIWANSYLSIPSGIYHSQKTTKLVEGSKMVYSGSGAPWQWMGQLSLLWQEIHRQDPTIEFLVVSRDPRTRILCEGIDESAIKFVKGSNVEEVHDFLQKGKIGFLIREEHLVNQVSFPIKFGEYLAAGLHVIVSDFDWECADFIRKKGGGLLVSNLILKNEATRIIRYFYSLSLESKKEAQKLSMDLSKENSLTNLIEILKSQN